MGFFSNFRKSSDSLDGNIESLGKKIDQLVAEKKSLQATLEKVSAKARDATVVINFDNMDVFSVERTADIPPRTVIGYYLPESDVKDAVLYTNRKVREWYLPCSDTIHETLCKQFIEWKEKQ